MADQFKDRVSLITGAGSGIGRAMAIAFAMAGARMVIADIDFDSAPRTAAEIGKKAWSAALVVELPGIEPDVKVAADLWERPKSARESTRKHAS